MTPQLSFVIPAKNEEANIEPLYDEISLVMQKVAKPYEIIFVDDGSTDNTFTKIRKLHAQDSRVKGLQLRGWFGKAVALQAGFEEARGEIVFTLDADLQDDPKEIPKILNKLGEGYDLVSGWKKKRYDPWTKVWPSRILNAFASWIMGTHFHDINCGFKAYRREVIKNLNLYGELFRFIPIFAAKQNFKVGEIAVGHRPRKHGQTKFGFERNIKGLLDLFTVIFLTGYLKRPAHFFGGIGLVAFSLGFFIGLFITYLRITTGTIQYRQPLLFLGILLMVIGVQLFTTGLLAEMIVNLNQKDNSTDKFIKEKLI